MALDGLLRAEVLSFMIVTRGRPFAQPQAYHLPQSSSRLVESDPA